MTDLSSRYHVPVIAPVFSAGHIGTLERTSNVDLVIHAT
jgi:hypothetical protein